MPKGRSKGFGHYMNKKFFHPGNPENLERVYIAKEKAAMKEKMEREKLQEYAREQETWENRAAISKVDKDRQSLSFMYNPPTGTKDNSASTSKGDDFKFEWQRNAPRMDHIKDDPNIVDHPFGIQVQFTKCMKCQIWGHQHTDKVCPRYGKARDNFDNNEEPAAIINEKKLIADMKAKERLEFTSYGTWDNGKVSKQYDLVYSDDEGIQHSDIMYKLLQEMRTKERKVAELRRKVRKTKSNKKSSKSKKRKVEERRSSKSERKKKKSSSESESSSENSDIEKHKYSTKKSKSGFKSKNSPQSNSMKRHHYSDSDKYSNRKRTKSRSNKTSSESESQSYSDSEETETESDSSTESDNSSDHQINQQTRQAYLKKLDDILFSDIAAVPNKPKSISTDKKSDSTTIVEKPAEKVGLKSEDVSDISNCDRKLDDNCDSEKADTKPTENNDCGEVTIDNPAGDKNLENKADDNLTEGKQKDISKNSDLNKVYSTSSIESDSCDIIKTDENCENIESANNYNLKKSDEISAQKPLNDENSPSKVTNESCDTENMMAPHENYLSEVDKILGLTSSGDKKGEASRQEKLEKETDEFDENGLMTESEMRLFNLISINKIDVKNNFAQAYHQDTRCHFCRTKETTEHLAVCPVYDNFMNGNEFKDIHSKNVKKVKRALVNIRKALYTRSKALSVTSIGPISAANMELLDVSKEKMSLTESEKKALEILDQQRFKIC